MLESEISGAVNTTSTPKNSSTQPASPRKSKPIRGGNWDEEADAELITLFNTQIPRARIADAMMLKFPKRKFTKNSVIGRLHRLGLGVTLDQARAERSFKTALKMAGVASKRRKRRQRPDVSIKAKEEVAPPPPPTAAEKRELLRIQRASCFVGIGLKSLETLERSDCRWPLEDAGKLSFCGCKTLIGKSYCHKHMVISARPVA